MKKTFPAPPAPLRVALICESRNSYSRELIGGIGEYALAHGPWWINYAEIGPPDRPERWLASWDGQGVIVRGESQEVIRAAEQLSTPVIDITSSRMLPKVPWVKCDDAAVAAVAAAHLLGRGFRHFGYCGLGGRPWSDRRGEEFARLVRGAGFECHTYVAPRRPRAGDEEAGTIAAWLSDRPRPLAVFTCHDARGRQVVDACRRARLAVPEEVAVLGVDNDELFSTLSPLPLSSVILNPRRTGWEAAALLDRMMGGEVIAPSAHFIPPIGVATRQSTDVTAVGDPRMVEALRFIRENACRGIGVGDVLRHCEVARRSLETRFRALLGRSPGTRSCGSRSAGRGAVGRHQAVGRGGRRAGGLRGRVLQRRVQAADRADAAGLPAAQRRRRLTAAHFQKLFAQLPLPRCPAAGYLPKCSTVEATLS